MGIESGKYTDDEDDEYEKTKLVSIPVEDSGISQSESSTLIRSRPILPPVPVDLYDLLASEELTCTSNNDDSSDDEELKAPPPIPGQRVFIPPLNAAPSKSSHRISKKPASISSCSTVTNQKRSIITGEEVPTKKSKNQENLPFRRSFSNNLIRRGKNQKRRTYPYYDYRLPIIPRMPPPTITNYNCNITVPTPEAALYVYNNLPPQFAQRREITVPTIAINLNRPSYNTTSDVIKMKKPITSQKSRKIVIRDTELPSESEAISIPVSTAPSPIPERLLYPPMDGRDLRPTWFWPNMTFKGNLVDLDDCQYVTDETSVYNEVFEAESVSPTTKKMEDLKITEVEIMENDFSTTKFSSTLSEIPVIDLEMDYKNSNQTQNCLPTRMDDVILIDDDDLICLGEIINPSPKSFSSKNERQSTMKEESNTIPIITLDDDEFEENINIEIKISEPVEAEDGEIDCQTMEIELKEWLIKMKQENKLRKNKTNDLLEKIGAGIETIGATLEDTCVIQNSPIFFNVFEEFELPKIVQKFRKQGYEMVCKNQSKTMMKKQGDDEKTICLLQVLESSVFVSNNISILCEFNINFHNCVLIWKRWINKSGIILDDISAGYLPYLFFKINQTNFETMRDERLFLNLLKWIQNNLKSCSIPIREMNDNNKTTMEEVAEIPATTIVALKLHVVEYLKRSKQNSVYRFII